MPLSIGIVGLPNVGKSTLFNAITNAVVEAQNYPFCTIEPNTGVVSIPDERLDTLSKLSGSSKLIPATIEFVDIAGLVKGASKGEGLGNQFLANISQTSAIAHVVRCFDDTDIVHVNGTVSPQDDIDIINTELLLSDLASCEKQLGNQQRKAKAQDKEAKAKFELLEKIQEQLSESVPIRSIDFSESEQLLMNDFFFLTAKKVIYVANVKESDLGTENDYVKQVRDIATKSGDEVVVICSKIEEELSELDVEEKAEYLKELGLKESGLDLLAKACFRLLGLETYLTTGEKETRAWTIKQGTYAPQAAGVIHTDFEKGFIRANVISYNDFVEVGGEKQAKEKGLMRQEGKEYIVKDGDVIEFLFNN